MKTGIMDTCGETEPDEIPIAIGSTEPTAEEMRHWTPEMRALAAWGGVAVPTLGCAAEEKEA